MGRWLLFLTLLLTAPALWAGSGWPAENPEPEIHIGGCAPENSGFYRGISTVSPVLHWGCNRVGGKLAPTNKEDGLLFARARYFSPTLGRWISRDPAGYVDGYSLYGGYFVPNANDPTGQFVPSPVLVLAPPTVAIQFLIAYRPLFSAGIYGLAAGALALGFFSDDIADYGMQLIEQRNAREQEYQEMQRDLLILDNIRNGFIPDAQTLQRLQIRGLLDKENAEIIQAMSSAWLERKRVLPSVIAPPKPPDCNEYTSSNLDSTVDEIPDDLQGMATPLLPNQYCVLYETVIPDSIFNLHKRKEDFRAANANLLTEARVRPQLAHAMNVLVPEWKRIQGKNKVLGLSPSENVTWHHVPGSKRIQLVWRYQHEQSKLKGVANQLYQALFHPNNNGGFADGSAP